MDDRVVRVFLTLALFTMLITVLVFAREAYDRYKTRQRRLNDKGIVDAVFKKAGQYQFTTTSAENQAIDFCIDFCREQEARR